MNVIQRPDAQSFCASMKDYIIDTDSTVTFTVEYGGKKILEEEYSPDASFRVHIRKLGRFCRLVLWGIWCDGATQLQNKASGVFSFSFNGVQDIACHVTYSRLLTRKDAIKPGFLSEVNQKVTRTGAKEYISLFMAPGERITLTLHPLSGDSTSVDFYVHEGTSTLLTKDVSLKKIMYFPPYVPLKKYVLSAYGGVYEFLIDQTQYVNTWCFRFKNVYDMPETLTAVGSLVVKPNNDSSVAAMFEVDRKFSVKVTDEYTANSGVIFLQSDYKLWHNMLNAQEVQIEIDGAWYPIIITKSNYERSFRKGVLKAVEFSFRMADPEQNNLIEECYDSN